MLVMKDFSWITDNMKWEIGMIEGNFVDVVSGDIVPARLNLYENHLVRITQRPVSKNHYIIPGMIDAHIHIESTKLCPSRFAEMAVPHGVTSVIADPHEIANVMGMEGINYMLADGSSVPMRFFFTAPSCVPATPWETSGAVIDWRSIRQMLEDPQFVALGEVMNYLGVINEDPYVMGKIEVAKQLAKPIDGHCPELTGNPLDKYIFAGISTDHESTRLDEAMEKHEKGMTIMVREGSASRNMKDLMPFARQHECFLVTDDMEADELIRGYMDKRLKMAVEYGMDPIHAIRAVTLWPAKHYELPIGTVDISRPLDFVIVKDLESFEVKEVYIDGRLVAKDGKPLFEVKPKEVHPTILHQDRSPQDFLIPFNGDRVKVRVIKVMERQIESLASEAELFTINGQLRPDPVRDIAIIAVANRYHNAPLALGFVQGFGLKRGAIASTVAHDSHNIVAVGVDPASLARAVNGVSRIGGYMATDGVRDASLELDVAGLMSTSYSQDVVDQDATVFDLVRDMGCSLPSPFMTLSFQCLLVLPELKISDRGLFDSRHMEFVDPIIG
jgi:adenine deaminase